MGENKSTKKIRYSLVIIAIAIIGFGVYYSLSAWANFQFPKVTAPPTQTSTPAPTPIADVTLSPNTQTVVLSLHQQTDFKTTISNNGNTIKFPCSITIISSVSIYGMSSYTSYIQPRNYGTYDFDVWIPSPSQAQTVLYYAVVQDSNGIKITSNTVTVEYK